MVVDDALAAEIERARARAVGGDPEGARVDLAALWRAATRAGDAFRACVAAHYLAHAQDAPRAQLAWHLRALRAADAVGDDRVAGFYPSLHGNVADGYLRLGDGARARRHVERARAAEHLLPDDGYGRMIRGLLARLDAATGL
ncbi:MAG TPA: hypothetical protein VFW96_17665 [Thermomicrobiales bacterium]|nr:hypothetical protein [Thermomicrobiales bacterium]